MKRVCVLLNGSISNDSRVIKEIKTMTKVALVDLYYIEGEESDKNIFDDKVRFFPYERRKGLLVKIIRNTCFYNEFMYYVPIVLMQGVKYDYIWANDLPDLKPALKLKKKLGSKVIYDSHEIFVETLNQCFPAKAVFYKHILHKICLSIMKTLGRIEERKMLTKVDHFVTTCESYKNFFISKYKSTEISIVMNCPKYNQDVKPYDLRSAFKIPQDGYILVFQGKLIPARALKETIDAMIWVKSNVFLIIVGDGMLQETLEKYVEDKNLVDRVYFTGRVQSSEMVNYAAGADAGINLQPNVNLSKYYGSTNKFFEYMHAEIPMIVSDTPENKLIMERYNMGVFVHDCYNPHEIADAINKLFEMNFSKFKDNCKEAAMKFNWENQEKVILDLIK